MPYTALISPAELAAHIIDPDWLVVDCRFSLVDLAAGYKHYRQSHIAGAVYANLNEDLSGSILPGVTGRHPLPPVGRAAAVFSRLGIGSGVQVVAYDDMGGALAAVRLWWMLRWLGHDAAAVLDGGWQRWRKEVNGWKTEQPMGDDSYLIQQGDETRPARTFMPHPRPEMVATTAEVNAIRQDPAYRLLDARSAERYHGQNETIDPVAGHIPGALSAPYSENLTSEGVFKSPEELRKRYRALVGDIPADHTIVYCGSGVTSIHNILAMYQAGMGEARLYAGSWSEWILDPSRPVEQ